MSLCTVFFRRGDVSLRSWLHLLHHLSARVRKGGMPLNTTGCPENRGVISMVRPVGRKGKTDPAERHVTGASICRSILR
jgi:hypothetical protein